MVSIWMGCILMVRECTSKFFGLWNVWNKCDLVVFHMCRYAKMWYKGVSFTSERCALVYMVDAAGTRTTCDRFSDISQDFSMSVFYDGSCYGPYYIQEAISILQRSQSWINDKGTENFVINNVRVSQTCDGMVR